MSLKLYKVTCKGMTTSSTGVAHGISYVLAGDPTDAYETVRTNLDRRDLGSDKDRELACIELIAENVDYPDCGTRVYA